MFPIAYMFIYYNMYSVHLMDSIWKIDVVVVGAGPVGLLTAIELTLGGARVLVLERLAAPSTAMKAMWIGPLGSEALQRRGMAAAIADEEARSLRRDEAVRRADRGGPAWSRVEVQWPFRWPAYPKGRAERAGTACPRSGSAGLEAMLADRSRSLGIEVRRECDVTRFIQQADGIDVEWASPAGEGHIRCSYLVGCDGGRSLIRKMAGFDFPGTAPTSTFYQVIAEIDHPERLLPIGWRRTSGGVFSYGPVPRPVIHAGFHRSARKSAGSGHT